MFNASASNHRALKKTITSQIESLLPESLLDLGTSVIVMEASCTAPGCVPLETVIMIIFPISSGEWNKDGCIIPTNISSQGTFKTKILKPLNEVVNDDVIACLPPGLGGMFDPVQHCITVRDIMFSGLEQVFFTEEDKLLGARYLMGALKEYVDAGCKAPEIGSGMVVESESEVEVTSEDVGEDGESLASDLSQPLLSAPASGNFIIKRSGGVAKANANPSSVTTSSSPTSASASASTLTPPPTSTSSPPPSKLAAVNPNTSRRAQASTNAMLSSSIGGDLGGGGGGSSSILQEIYAREHAPGVRRRNCPCCDPDDPANVVDMMMMM